MMLLKSNLLSVFLATLSFNFDTLYAQEDDEINMMTKMCACASKHFLCNKKCPEIRQELFESDDEDCKGYADQAFGCGTAFSAKQTYERLCPSIGVPCTNDQHMCACASKHDICDKTCFKLFNIKDDPKCQSYVGSGICNGFPTKKLYSEHCPKKLNMPCTTSQKMCACANKHSLCSKTCGALFDVDDSECNKYAGDGLGCGGDFPWDVRYQDHCETEGIKMTCKRGACRDNKEWRLNRNNSSGFDKSCEWVKRDKSKRCNDEKGLKKKSSNEMCKDTCNTCE